MTEVLPVVLAEQLIPVVVGHLDCADEGCLNRRGDCVFFFGRATFEQIHLYERHEESPFLQLRVSILGRLWTSAPLGSGPRADDTSVTLKLRSALGSSSDHSDL